MPGPITIQHQGNGIWIKAPSETPIHLAALFRKPEIRSGRIVNTVLDLACVNGQLRHPKVCWTRMFVQILRDLPSGLTVALDNGVRCPFGTSRKIKEFNRRAELCHNRTVDWLQTLAPDPPPVLFCDKSVCVAYAQQKGLTHSDGTEWTEPKKFLDAVGEEVLFHGRPALILAHPRVVQMKVQYRDALRAAIPKIRRLAGL
ncbi:MAG TPA: hypothetical protein VHT73_12285 [Thermodesulfobacteriota bacterium]|nr:hypothetical protein [Thermodesulfobacteriota bacterium]